MVIPTTSRAGWPRVLAALALIALAAWALKWAAIKAFDHRFHSAPVKLALPMPSSVAEGMRQDLQVLAQLPQLDRSFTPETLARFEGERMKLDERVAQLSPEEFEMQVSRLVAIAGNGHTGVVGRSRRLNLVPLRLAWFDEGLFVTRAKDPHANLVGSEVLAIDGQPPRTLLEQMKPFVSGTAQWTKAVSPLLLQSPAALKGMGFSRDGAVATFTLRLPTGETVSVNLPAESPQPPVAYADPARNYSPLPVVDVAGWHATMPRGGVLPLALREPDASVYTQKIDHGQGLYVHLNSIMGDERGGLSQQLRNIVDAIEPRSLRYAVLDLRGDGGGNYMETIDFTKQFPTRITADGKLFILTDAATFSAAIVTLARAKYFAGPRAVIVGGRMGDTEQFWAESGARLELPNSKIMVNFATGWHDWANGCGWANAGRCFWFNLAYDVPAGSLSPDVTVPWRFADFSRGVDTAMEEVMRRVPRPAP